MSLFIETGQYTKEGSEISREFQNIIEEFIGKYNMYKIVELGYIMMNSIPVLLSKETMHRFIKKIREGDEKTSIRSKQRDSDSA